MFLDPKIGYRLLGVRRANGVARQKLLETFGHFDPAEYVDGIYAVAFLHGKMCIPHPNEPASADLAGWITYDQAHRITGLPIRTLYGWRQRPESAHPSAVRLLQWVVHGVCLIDH